MQVDDCMENRTRAATARLKNIVQGQATRFQLVWRRLAANLGSYAQRSTLNRDFVLYGKLNPGSL